MLRKVAAIGNVLALCIVILAVSAAFVYNAAWIGIVLIGLGIICLVSLLMFKIQIRSTAPDIVFGVVDNGILAAMAVLGGEIAGVFGAVVGGVVGNAVTDGIAGMLEGYWAEFLKSGKRTILGSAVGKMAGCLFGAGVVLVLDAVFK